MDWTTPELAKLRCARCHCRVMLCSCHTSPQSPPMFPCVPHEVHAARSRRAPWSAYVLPTQSAGWTAVYECARSHSRVVPSSAPQSIATKLAALAASPPIAAIAATST